MHSYFVTYVPEEMSCHHVYRHSAVQSVASWLVYSYQMTCILPISTWLTLSSNLSSPAAHQTFFKL